MNHLLLRIFLLSLFPSYLVPCPIGCHCDRSIHQIECNGKQITSSKLAHFNASYTTLIFKNTSIRSIEKQSFKKLSHLESIQFDDHPSLTTIDKFAFKGLPKLRLIRISRCSMLTEIHRNSFSSINNKKGLRIIIELTPIRMIEPMAFKNAHNIRELAISGSNMALNRHSLGSITQLDFLTISGLSLIEPDTFVNSSRFHLIHIQNSTFDIPNNAFNSLSHISHFLIEHSTIDSIAPDAFALMSTCRLIELNSNKIGTISSRAFTNAINVGEVRLTRNSIDAFDTVESLISPSLITRVEENWINCSCELKWMTALKNISNINFCKSTTSIANSFLSIYSFTKTHCNTRRNIYSDLSQSSTAIRPIPLLIILLSSFHLQSMIVRLLFIPVDIFLSTASITPLPFSISIDTSNKY